MKIVVCIKQVPDTETKVKIAADGKSLDPAGVDYVLNPYDEYAVEEAIKLKEANGSEVTILCLGTEAATKAIRTGLAMGADNAVLLKDENAAGRDWLSVAKTLAEELKALQPDLIFFGKQAMDDDSAAVGTAVAQILGLPSVANITSFALEGATATVQREVEGGIETLTATLPAIFTAHKGLNEPRYPSLKGIMSAKKKPVEEKAAAVCENGTEVVSMALPPERPPGKVIGEGVEAVEKLIDLLKNEAKVL